MGDELYFVERTELLDKSIDNCFLHTTNTTSIDTNKNQDDSSRGRQNGECATGSGSGVPVTGPGLAGGVKRNHPV